MPDHRADKSHHLHTCTCHFCVRTLPTWTVLSRRGCLKRDYFLRFHSYCAQVLYGGHRVAAASPAHELRAEGMSPCQRAGGQQHGRVKHGRKQDRRDALHTAPLRRRGSPDEATREGHGAGAGDAEDAEEHERLPAALPPGRARLCRPPPEDRTEVVVAWWCHMSVCMVRT